MAANPDDSSRHIRKEIALGLAARAIREYARANEDDILTAYDNGGGVLDELEQIALDLATAPKQV